MSITNLELKHWKIKITDEGIVWLGIDQAGSSTNVLAHSVIQELEKCITEIEADIPVGMIIYSLKKSGYIAGADVSEFTTLHNEDEAYEYIREAQTLFDRIENLSCPTLAMINGFCLGGGTELSLACRYRLACDNDKTKLGLPEVKLGIHPGFGGTVRILPRMGVFNAMNTMLSGRVLSARAAAKTGLVDFTVPARHLETAAVSVILDQPKNKKPSLFHRLASKKLFRSAVAWFLTRKVAQRVNQAHYPAPFEIIKLWKEYADDPELMMLREARSVAKLMTGSTAKNLIRVFFLQEQLKAQGKQSKFTAQQVHVIGAGVMGGDIAAWCALRGLRVTLQDQSPERIAPAIKRAASLFKKRLKKPRLIQAAMDRLIPDVNGLGVKTADVVIEAIFENLEAKQELYKILEPQMKEDALLTTNTSSIPIEELSASLAKPGRLVGLHFFNPVAKMQLIEIVSGTKTYPEIVKAASSFARQIGRLPLPVKSTPGFLVNRILMPYLLEAVELLTEGVQAELIDKVALDFGMPMGPVELADTVGLDICLSVAEILTAHLGGSVPELLRDKVHGKILGRKTGTGFYTYKKGKALKKSISSSKTTPEIIRERLVSRLLNEAMTCLREQVVDNADLLDAGIIFGTGFAPFRGGPMHYAEVLGYDAQKTSFIELEQEFGERFHPDEGWDNIKQAS